MVSRSHLPSNTVQTSIADEFLAEFEADDDLVDEQQQPTTTESKNEQSSSLHDQKKSALLQLGEEKQLSEDILAEKAKQRITPSFNMSTRLQEHVKKISEFLKKEEMPMGGPRLVDDPEYPYIVQSNNIAVDIDNEIALLHKYIQDGYSKKFPELENHVLNPLDYARVVQRIGNKTDLSGVDMTDILPSSINMVVKVTFSTTSGKQLTDEELDKVMKACDEMFKLQDIKMKILEYVASRMNAVAPNLSKVVGTAIAAQLIGIAGGIEALSKIPASNIQLLGQNRKILAGFGSRTQVKHVGYIGECEIMQKTPPSIRKRVARLIATKCTLAARADSFHSAPDASIGERLREKIEETIKKWLAPPPAKQEKPLPAPDDRPKKKRGGRKARMMKEKYGLTEMRKKFNRIAFGVAQHEDMETGEGYGLLGINQSGSLRLKAKTKIKKKPLPGGKTTVTRGPGLSQISGLASSLTFTPVQGIELQNPSILQKRKQTNKYFDNLSFFKEPKKPKLENEFKVPNPVKKDNDK